MNYKNLTLELLNHDAVRITTEKHVYIYIDPFQLNAEQALPKADFLFVTHTHQDHCSLEDIQKIISADTIVLCVPDAQSKFLRFKCKEMILLEPGKEISLSHQKHAIHVRAVPAYNIGKAFHPKENQWVGYIIDIDGTTVYHTGDTDLIPEMKDVGPVDIAFFPVSGTYVMTAEEAAKAVAVIKPAVAIPMHYGAIIGSQVDADAFVELVKNSSPQVQVCKLLQ